MLALSIVTAWVAVAVASGQPLSGIQTSSLLMSYGATDGSVFYSQEWWRILTSQWLHVRGLHMLFNAGLVLLAGSALEPVIGSVRLILLYVVGGSIGIIASVLAYPDLVSSGASQAALALSGSMLLRQIPRGRPSVIWVLVAAATVIQLGLDVLSDAHMVKAGHAAGLAAGMVAAVMPGRGRARGG